MSILTLIVYGWAYISFDVSKQFVRDSEDFLFVYPVALIPILFISIWMSYVIVKMINKTILTSLTIVLTSFFTVIIFALFAILFIWIDLTLFFIDWKY